MDYWKLVLPIAAFGSCAVALSRSPATQPVAPPSTGPAELSKVVQIEITPPPNPRWFLTIRPDGSASIQYGSGPGDSASLPAGTLNFQAIAAEVVKRESVKTIPGSSSAVLWRKGEHSAEFHSLTNDDYFRNLIESVSNKWRKVPRFDELRKEFPIYPPVTDRLEDHKRAAQGAEARIHTLCDQWADAIRQGADLKAIGREIASLDYNYRSEAMKAGYIANAASFNTEFFADAGKFTMDNGKSYSYVIVGSDRSLEMWVWARVEWTAERLPPHGVAGSLGLPSDGTRGKLTIGKVIRSGSASGTVFKVAYLVDGVSGNVEFHVADFSVHPDRGTVDAVGNWKPFSSTRPADRQQPKVGSHLRPLIRQKPIDAPC